jgi:type I restriction enzyme S subunit
MKEGWEIVNIGSICNITTGKLDANASSESGVYPFFTCSRESLKIDNYAYDCECVLIAGNGDLNVKYYKGKFNAYQRTYIVTLKNDIKDVSVKYIFKFFEKYVEKLRQLSVGGVIKYIKLGDLTNAKIPVPPLSEQEKIVAELDCLSGIIEKKKQQLKELDSLAQSIFYEMFGDPVENEKGWEVKPLKEVAPNKVYKGEVPSVNDKYWLLNLDMISSNTGDIIQKCYFDLEEIGNSTIVFNDDNVLYSKLRPYLNKVVVPNEIGYATSELIPLYPDKLALNRVFLASLLRSSIFVEYISSKVAGAKMPRVSMGDFWIFPVILPPLSLQQQFANKIELIEKQKELIKQSIKETETLFDSRMDYYFNS